MEQLPNLSSEDEEEDIFPPRLFQQETDYIVHQAVRGLENRVIHRLGPYRLRGRKNEYQKETTRKRK